MKKLKLLLNKIINLKTVSIFVLIFVLFFGITYFQQIQLNKLRRDINKKIEALESKQDTFSSNFSESLYSEHLYLSNNENLESDFEQLKQELNNLKSQETYSFALQISNIYKKIDDYNVKSQRNTSVKLEVPNYESVKNQWSVLLLNKKFDELIDEIDQQNTLLDQKHNEYLASIAPPPSTTQSGSGEYSYLNVSTEKGNFNVHLIKMSLNNIKVKTISAHDKTCTHNCSTKSLADYIKDDNAYAGINGTYFCPPDYSACQDKINSFDYAFYDSNQKKWENEKALSWFKTGLMTFNGNSPKFYSKSSDYGGQGVTAGISNYPSLISDGKIVVNSNDLTSFQKDIKGPRGAIGYDSKNLYLAIVQSATVIDAAYVMRAVGAEDALNLDGGGSSAMYINGSYVVGPGRSLPNAIIISK